MKKIILTNVRFEDLWTRFSRTEKHLCCTRNSGRGGWDSFIAWNPSAVFVGNKYTGIENWKNFVRKEQASGRRIFGYLSYDLGYSLLNIKPKARNYLNLPEIYFYSFDKYLLCHKNSIEICAPNRKELKRFSEEVRNVLKRPTNERKSASALTGSELKTITTLSKYSKQFEKIRNYIIDGHVYQTNLTHTLEGETEKSPRRLFLEVFKKNKADFSAYMECQGFEIISASPERFIKISPDRVIETFPIKGTRPRGKTPLEDRELRSELEKSEKESAELFMITDLLRNDVGKICEFGSVSVMHPRLMRSLPSVWHSFSHIKGKLKKGIRSADALLSMFPGGSISGCPKKRALEVIDEVEHRMRGIYTGAIGFIDPDDTLDFNLAIRTFVKKKQKVYLSVGGGIVFDSKIKDEYKETLDKAKSFFGILK